MTQDPLDPTVVAGRIRAHRMGDLAVTVQDESGRPVPGATVRVEQTGHAFLFGANIFRLNPASNTDDQLVYQERFKGLLNYATLPFYWGGFECERGKPDYERLAAMAEWCARHGIVTKGHPLIWHEVRPRWEPDEPDDVIPLLKQRVFDIIHHYAGTIRKWDVINEANVARTFLPDSAVSRWVRREGRAQVVATALAWAREAASTSPLGPGEGPGERIELLYNDYEHGPDNMELLGELRQMGALPDAIGIQSHMHSGSWPLSEVWQILENYAPFDRPLHFTELTVLSGANRQIHDVKGKEPEQWPSTPEGEARQADYVESLYRLLFSHPQMRAINWWDFSDHAWLNAPAGLLRDDMSPKPAYDRLRDLFRNEWWTSETVTTGADGQATVRAFHGSHTVTVDGRVAEAVITESTASVDIGLGG